MVDPPDLDEDRIRTVVAQDYGLPVTTLTFLPLGQDVRAWAYRAVTAGGVTLFLKLRQGTINAAALRVPRYLADQGVPPIVAPLRTRTHQLWTDVDKFTLALYPFIEGSTGGVHGLQLHHWLIYGAALRAVHDTTLPADFTRAVPTETFSARWPARVRVLDAARARWHGTVSVEGELAAVWQEQHTTIAAMVEHLATLGQQLRATPPPLVLCHGDIHHNNVLIDTDDRFWIVDWDDTRLAPKECDLMMGVGGLNTALVGPREEGWFLQGYGRTTIDPIALAYYRYLRAVGDLAEYGEQVWLLQGVSEATKRNALERTRRLFSPGSILTVIDQAGRSAT